MTDEEFTVSSKGTNVLTPDARTGRILGRGPQKREGSKMAYVAGIKLVKGMIM